MATYSAILQESYSTYSHTPTPLVASTSSGAVASGAISGILDDTSPYTFGGEVKAGVLDRNVPYTLYDRIIITLPNEVSSNSSIIRTVLAADENVTFLLWNSSRSQNASIVDYTFDVDVDGINVTDITLPKTLLPLYYTTGTYEITTVGNFNIDGYVTWGTSINEVTTYFNFLRGLIITYLPLMGSYKEIEFFVTNLFTSDSNTEKRLALQATKKYMFDYDVPAYPNAKAQALSNISRLFVERVMLHPVWSSASIIDTIVSDVVTCDTTYKDFSLHAMLYTDNDTFEIVNIDSKTDVDITLSQAPLGSFGSGDLIVPLRAVTMDTKLNSTFKALDNATFNIKAEEISLLESFVGTPDAFPVYATYDVLNIKPEFEPNYTHTNEFALLGKSYNKRLKYNFFNQEETIDFDYFLQSEIDIYNFRNFFRDQQGRFNKFWLPSWKIDFTVQNAYSIGSTALIVSGVNAKYMAHIARHIFIEPDFYAKVDSYTIIDENTVTLNLDTPITRDLVAGEAISNLYFVRFDQDDLAIEYDNFDFSNAKISCKFKELQPETP